MNVNNHVILLYQLNLINIFQLIKFKFLQSGNTVSWTWQSNNMWEPKSLRYIYSLRVTLALRKSFKETTKWLIHFTGTYHIIKFHSFLIWMANDSCV